jgi:hypothetical protein
MEDSSVTGDMPGSPEKPGLRVSENKNMIIAGIVVGFLILAVVAVLFIQLPSGGKTPESAVIKNITAHQTTVPSSITPKITKTIRPTGDQTARQTPTKTATPSVPVDFSLQSGTPSSCGLTCRQMDASITNAGYAIAHNVCIDVSMHNSKDVTINLNGEPSLVRCIGDIGAGQTKTEAITINADCGVFATKCIGETLTLKTRITSVEKTVQFPDQLIAV